MKYGYIIFSVLFIFMLILPVNATTDEEMQTELDKVRELMNQAIVEYEKGNAEKAYKLARSAYLDHFENVEVLTRSVAPDLTLELEIEFAQFREMIKRGEPVEDVKKKAEEIYANLEKLEGFFEESSVLAPVIGVVISFSIMFREGLEAVLISAIIIAYLERTRNYHMKKYVYLGIVLALLASIVTWFAASTIISLSGADKEVVEVATSFLAVIVLFYVSFWLLRRTDEKRWIEFIEARSWHAMQSGNYVALTLLSFFAIYREGFETVLFYQALYSMVPSLSTWLTLGIIVSSGALVVIGMLVFVFGTRLPTKQLFALTIAVAASLSIFFIGNAVRELQVLGYIPITSLTHVLPKINPVLADLIGYRRTLETIAAQAILVAVYVAGGIYMWHKSRRGEGVD